MKMYASQGGGGTDGDDDHLGVGVDGAYEGEGDQDAEPEPTNIRERELTKLESYQLKKGAKRERDNLQEQQLANESPDKAKWKMKKSHSSSPRKNDLIASQSQARNKPVQPDDDVDLLGPEQPSVTLSI